MSFIMAGPDETTSEVAPRAAFGLATATFVVISSMIGTGVLTTSGFTTFFVGSNQLMLLLWVLGGVIAACGALTLCELAAAMPRSGGDYVFLHETYGPLAAFLSGWVSFLIGFGGPIAASSAAAAKYLLAPLHLAPGSTGTIEGLLATGAIVAFGAIHCVGRSATVRAQAAMTGVKLVILFGLALALLLAGDARWSNLADRPPITPKLGLSMASSLVFIAYAYTGWNGAAYIAGEVDRPQRQMPRAILLGTAIVTVLYLALNLGYALALSVADIGGVVAKTGDVNAVAPIAEIAVGRLYGPRVAGPLSMAIGLTLFASVSAYVLTGPRVAYAMARAGQCPAFAGRLSPRFGTPVAATVLQVVWALVLLWTASFEKLLVYSGLGLAVFSMLTVSAVFVLRWRRPDLSRPFQTPGYPFVPLFYLISTGMLVVAVLRERPTEGWAAVATVLVGIPVYLLWGLLARRGLDAARP
jgi:APA family basic amino acid/polyamine antiporter